MMGKQKLNQNQCLVKLATISDAEAIARVHVQSWKTTYVNQVPQEYLDNMSIADREKAWRENLSEATLNTFIAESSGNIVGFARVGASRDKDTESSTGEIEAIYLTEEAKGQGIGRELWKKSIETLKSSGFSEAIVWVLETNSRARTFYEKMGFKLDGKHKVINIGGSECKEVRYFAKL